MQLSFGHRLMAVLIPTPAQALICFGLALVVLVIAQAQELLRLIGIGDIAINAAQSEFHNNFSSVLTSPLASSSAVVTFWAVIGLVAYVICWGAYNVLIETRNEITLETKYVNRGHWRGPYQTIGLKIGGTVVLSLALFLLVPGLALWLTLAAPLIASPSVINAVVALSASIGLAIQLYLVLAFALITFTPWYRPEAFTD